MVPKLPLISCKELLSFLKKEGFKEIRQSGSHKFLRHPDGRTTVVPIHNNRDLPRGFLKEILDEIDMARDEITSKYK